MAGDGATLWMYTTRWPARDVAGRFLPWFVSRGAALLAIR